ncbi:hypothetical protein AB0H73_35120 [Streptomyces olivoreticuli]
MTDRITFLDCEFDPRDTSLAGLLSLGITDNDGHDYYAVHAGADLGALLDHAFILENVLPHLPVVLSRDPAGTVAAVEWDPHHAHFPHVRTSEQIAADLESYFSGPDAPRLVCFYGAQDICRLHSLWNQDWSAMPSGVPTYFTDLRVLADELGVKDELPVHDEIDGAVHHALADARWNRHAYRFLRSLQTAGRVEDIARKLCAIDHHGMSEVGAWECHRAEQGSYRRAARLLLDAYDMRPR